MNGSPAAAALVATARPLRVVVVDDEPRARAGMAALAAREPGFVVVAECGDGPAAVAAIGALAPDVVLLDVQMFGMDGFEVVARTAAGAASTRAPRFIFVTAHEEHALRTFEVAALDYLLKPFDDRRFRDALARARDARGDAHERTAHREATLVAGPPAARVLVRESQLDWVEAADYCVLLHVGGRSHLLRASLDELAARLDPAAFLRIHRGALVRADRIAELRRDAGGRMRALLRDGSELPVSRRGKAALAFHLARAARLD